MKAVARVVTTDPIQSILLEQRAPPLPFLQPGQEPIALWEGLPVVLQYLLCIQDPNKGFLDFLKCLILKGVLLAVAADAYYGMKLIYDYTTPAATTLPFKN